MGLKRRAFLQQTGLTLAALGVNEIGLSLLGDRYHRVLAQPTARKLALLVGINQYPESMYDRSVTHGSALAGCVTDVELQRELLIHRFDFSDRDILTLTDRQATRQNIETAFLEHLTQQAQPGDVVVFHFSGYGSRIKPDKPSEEMQSSLVPVDAILQGNEGATVNDLLEDTLLLLLRSLQTDRVTTVLDTSYLYSGVASQGNLRIRSRPKPVIGQASPDELAFQEQLLSQIKSSRDQVGVQRRSGQLPGVVLAAAGPIQLTTDTLSTTAAPLDKAFEMQLSGFSAGLFTYALTQYLWSSAAPLKLQSSFNRAAASVEQSVGKEQKPILIGQQSRQQALLSYYLSPAIASGAEGVVRSVDDDGRTAQLWLAGLPANVLELYGVNSLLTLLPVAPAKIPSGSLNPATETPPPEATAAPVQVSEASVATPPQQSALSPSATEPNLVPLALPKQAGQPLKLQLVSRNGLTAKARLCSGSEVDGRRIQTGQWVQESLRLLPRNIKLAVALDSSLERIERVDATSAFSSMPYVVTVAASEQPADYLFGRVNDASRVMAVASTEATTESALLPVAGSDLKLAQGSYGLFSPHRNLIAHTSGEGGEAVKSAVQRIAPQIKILLATKLLRLTANEGSSHLRVKAALELLSPDPQTLLQRETVRTYDISSDSGFAPTAAIEAAVPSLPTGSKIQYRVRNDSDRPIYCLLLGIDSSGSVIALYSGRSHRASESLDSKASFRQDAIAPGEALTLPQASNAFQWSVRGPAGLSENQLILSDAPFTQTVAILESTMRPLGEAQRLSTPSNVLEVAQAILQDLHQASSSTNAVVDIPVDMFALNVRNWATLSFVYQVTESRA